MRLLLGILLALITAAAVGLGSTWVALSRGISFGTVTIQGWQAAPKVGTPDIDPYSRAGLARRGDLPLSAGDGIAFVAKADDAGRALDGGCDVTISGTTPPARYWTLTLYNPQGNLIPNAANRYGFTSQELVRRMDGNFDITIAPRARPGNWLPSGGAGKYVLVLRLYDAPTGVATRTNQPAAMPAIIGSSCG